MARLNDATIDEITQAIIAARTIWVAGYRSNQSFAAYFRWQIFQFLPKAQLLPGPGETIGEYMANFEASDCLVAFGVRRRARPLQHLIAQAGRSKTKVVLITDHLFGASRSVDWMIRCDAKAPGALDNHTAVIAFCDLLITRLFHATGKKAGGISPRSKPRTTQPTNCRRFRQTAASQSRVGICCLHARR